MALRDARIEHLEDLAAVARTQRGVISRDQMRDLGVTDTWIAERIEEKILRRVLPEVYAFGHGELTREAMQHAAVMSGGEGAALSHRSAAAFWGLIRKDGARPDIIVMKDRGVAGDLIDAHRCRLFEEDVIETGGMRVTLPMRTLVDLSEVVGEADLAAAFNQALMRELFNRPVLDRLIVQAFGRHGLKPLRKILQSLQGGPEDVRSRGEWRARQLLIDAGVGKPRMNAAIALGDGRYRFADLYFDDVKLDIEIDGPHHRLPHVQAEDAVRTAELRPLGVTVDRYPDTILDEDPAGFVAAVAARLAELREVGT